MEISNLRGSKYTTTNDVVVFAQQPCKLIVFFFEVY